MPVTPRWIAMFAAVLLASVAHADPPANTELNGDPIDPRTYRAWAGNYRTLARYCAAFEGDFLVVPDYERRVPSSRGLTRSRANDELTVTWRETRGGLSQNRMREPEPEEVHAYAYLLPSVEVGTYGYLHSVEIVEILGPEEMLVREVWLVDRQALRAAYDRDSRRARESGARNFREQLDALYEHRQAAEEMQDDEPMFDETHRLIGYPTRGLRAGERWEGEEDEGIQVALARWELPELDDGDGTGSRRRSTKDPRMLMVNPQRVMRDTLDEAGMMRLLDARGLTVAAFVEMMREMREQFRDRDEADQRLIQVLLPPMPEEEDD